MYKRREASWLKHLDFMLLDFVLLQLAFFLSYLLKYHTIEGYAQDAEFDVLIVISLLDLIASLYMRNYTGVLRRNHKRELTSVVKMVVLVWVGAILWLFLKKESAKISREMMMLFPVLAVAFLFLGRTVLKMLIRKRKSRRWHRRSIVIVCDKDDYVDLLDTFINDPVGEYLVRAVVLLDEDEAVTDLPEGVVCITDRNELMQFLVHEWVDAVFLCKELDPNANNELTAKCLTMGITVHRALIKYRATSTHRVLEQMGGYMVMTQSIKVVDSRRMLVKRLMDIVGGLVGVIFTGILCIFIGPIIFIKSPGPIFFKQERIGENGRRFFIYKFRSMYLDAEERKKELMAKNNIKDGMMFKMDNDPRIIKGIGHFIRNHSLDEFPQFWNVLKGDMSLIGTRPPTPDEWEKYELHHRSRLAVKPGITGAWQVGGRSDITDFEKVVQMDVDYIRHWSLSKDIKIIFKTIGVILKKDGAENR